MKDDYDEYDDAFYEELDKKVSGVAFVIVVTLLVIGGIIGYFIGKA